MSDEPIFAPNREHRRRVEGLQCCACDEPMASSDILGIRTEDAVLWMHATCVRQLLQNAKEES